MVYFCTQDDTDMQGKKDDRFQALQSPFYHLLYLYLQILVLPFLTSQLAQGLPRICDDVFHEFAMNHTVGKHGSHEFIS